MADLDDDFMLNNIVFSKPKTQSTLKKADLKKQKYAQKIKDQRKKSAQKETSFSQNKLIDSLNSDVNSSRQPFKREENESKPKPQFKK